MCIRLKNRFKLTDFVRQKIIRELTEEQWSPEQIVGRAKRDGTLLKICQALDVNLSTVVDVEAGHFAKSKKTDNAIKNA